jgi:hypothetical protein
MTRDPALPSAFLVTRLAVKEGEALRELPVDDARPAFDPARSVDWRDRASSLGTIMNSGDELWTWSNPKWAWDDMMGRAGFAVVRNGEVMDYSLVIMN